MDKIAVGPGLPKGVVDIDKTPAENVKALAGALDKPVEEVMVCVLDRTRHSDLIAALRQTGCKVKLIGDGDVAGVIATTEPGTGVDLYLGSGGAPEGVLAAAALRCIGGQMQGRLLFRNDDEKARAAKWGIKDLDRKYDMMDMASGNVIFAAAGVTDGSMLRGVHKNGDTIETETLVMRSETRTVRHIAAIHRVEV